MTNETKTSGVPTLNLAPRLTRPLSLWNPLDYLRLLYWVFYFPQAIRWYVETFAQDEETLDELINQLDPSTGRFRNPDSSFRRWFRESPIQIQLWFQGLLLQITSPVLICYFCHQFGLTITWAVMAIGVAIGVAIGAVVVLGEGVAFNVVFGVAFGMILGCSGGILFDGQLGRLLGVEVVTWGVLDGVPFGLALSMAFRAVYSVAGGVAVGMAKWIAAFIITTMLGSMTLGILSVGSGMADVGGVAAKMGGMAAGWAAAGVAFSVAVLRPELWLFALRPGTRQFRRQQWNLSKVATAPQFQLSRTLNQWLQNDWVGGLELIDQLQRY